MDVYKEWLGIPDGPRPPNHYELLRCPRFEDDVDKVRAHYKKLNAHVRKYATGQYSIQSQELLNELAKGMLCLTDAERKREYDESLGREFAPERDSFGRIPLLDVLVEQNKISPQQKSEVEDFADRRGLSIRDAVVQMKLATPTDAAKGLARQLGYSFIELEETVPEDDALDLVPRQLVKQHSFVPLFIDDDRVLIACADEPEHELEDELRLRFGTPIRTTIATPRAINQAIATYYAPGMRDEVKSARSKNIGQSGTSSKGASKKSTKVSSSNDGDSDTGGVNKGVVISLMAVMTIPVFFEAACAMSNSVLLYSRQYPALNKLWIISLIAGSATFAYVKLKLKK
ncbi:MAG: hypothetical protein R3C01_17615 [Planctomycetaceae bacterium]